MGVTSGRGDVMPRARATGLVVQVVGDDTLVYDLRRHKAHCLNRTATFVWGCCDGRTRVSTAAARLERELQLRDGETLVRTGLDQLARARLLEAPPRDRAGRTRREVIRTLGLAGAASLVVPLVESIVSPVPAEAASCVTAAQCEAMLVLLCNGQPICGSPGDCCVVRGVRCRARKC
jgi:hypothetical protein